MILCGASVTGPSHKKNGIANQDSFLMVKKRRYMLFVVSDGMGSKPFADIGSKKACEAVKTEMTRFVRNKKEALPVPELFSNIVTIWKDSLLPLEAKDCSATCLFVFATKSRVLAARLGDGMICLLGKESSGSVVLMDDKDGDFSNETFSLSDPEAADEFRYAVYDRSLFKGVVLSTDGISADMENGREISFAEDIFEELKKKPFWRRSAFIKNMMLGWPVPHDTDDKTLVTAGL